MRIFGLIGAEKSFDQSDKYVLSYLTTFVNSVLGFLPCCSSNSVFFSSVCTVNRISLSLFPASILTNIKFFSVCIAPSTVPIPVCNRGVQYSISIFRFLQNSRYSFEIKPPLYRIWFFSGISYKLKLLDKNCVTCFVSEVFQIFTLGHLLNRSKVFSICTSPWIFLLCSFPVKTVCISCPGSVSISNFL